MGQPNVGHARFPASIAANQFGTGMKSGNYLNYFLLSGERCDCPRKLSVTAAEGAGARNLAFECRTERETGGRRCDTDRIRERATSPLNAYAGTKISPIFPSSPSSAKDSFRLSQPWQLLPHGHRYARGMPTGWANFGDAYCFAYGHADV